jgi:hypothetical protein
LDKKKEENKATKIVQGYMTTERRNQIIETAEIVLLIPYT